MNPGVRSRFGFSKVKYDCTPHVPSANDPPHYVHDKLFRLIKNTIHCDTAAEVENTMKTNACSCVNPSEKVSNQNDFLCNCGSSQTDSKKKRDLSFNYAVQYSRPNLT